MLVLPMMTAPAAFSRETTRASSAGWKSLKCGKPHVVGRPATLNGSFNVTGMPSKWLPLAAAKRGIGGTRGVSCAIEIANDDGIDPPIQRLDARDRMLDQL